MSMTDDLPPLPTNLLEHVAKKYGFTMPPEVDDTTVEMPDVVIGSWARVDVEPVLDGTYQDPIPTIGQRGDGVGLFYPGLVHTVVGESESGKTWLAISSIIDVLCSGETVVYLDFEDNVGGIVRRLVAAQVSADTIRQHFVYVRPTELLGTGSRRDAFVAMLRVVRPKFIVLDGVTEAMTLSGLNLNDNNDIATFSAAVPKMIRDETGAAVLMLDHVTKDREGRGRYAIGGVHKINGLDGAAYTLETVRPFGRGLTGRSRLRIAKDRPGQLRDHAVDDWFGDLVVESHHDGGWLEVTIEAPADRCDEPFRPTVLMGRIMAAIEEHGPLSQAKIEALVKGKSTTIRTALTLLRVDGYVTDTTPHRVLRPWDET